MGHLLSDLRKRVGMGIVVAFNWIKCNKPNNYVNRIDYRVMVGSNSIMVLSNNKVSCLHISDENVSVLDVNAEFLLKCFMDLDGSININIASLVVPVGVEGNRHALRYVYQNCTFQRSGSVLFNLSLMQLMILFAVSPGWLISWVLFREFQSECGGTGSRISESSLWSFERFLLSSSSPTQFIYYSKHMHSMPIIYFPSFSLLHFCKCHSRLLNLFISLLKLEWLKAY